MTEQQEEWTGKERRSDMGNLRQQVHTQAVLLATMVICFAIMIGVVAFGIVKENRQRQDSRQFGETLLGCILETLAEQQANQKAAHDALAKAEGITIQRPEEIVAPEDLAANVRTACQSVRQQ